uniref:Uncharacterized protein n=1 Tax=Anguilla anguilla TaxID=7936 RepID=A0A0E9S9V7_ANGAN
MAKSFTKQSNNRILKKKINNHKRFFSCKEITDLAYLSLL